MNITENPDGSFTATPEHFRDCEMIEPDDQASDCWYTGATHAITYSVHGLDGRYVLEVCEDHIPQALEDLHHPARAPYTTHALSVTALP